MTVEEARLRWLEERKTHEEFGRLVAQRIYSAASARGVVCEVSSRAKEPYSLVKKLLKGRHTYDSMPDRVGARCVVRYLHDLDIVVDAASETFLCGEVDRKAEGLGTEKLGYLSIHVDVRLRSDDSDVVRFGNYRAELQIRTLGQHLWSEMSHDSVYKNDARIAALPETIRRRVNLMAGLIEVADQEFDRLNKETQDETAEIYRALERHYYTLTSRGPDVELSVAIIELLRPLYNGLPTAQIKQLIDTFWIEKERDLRAIYADPSTVEQSALYSQPEILMLLERLTDDAWATRKRWNEEFPPEELERAANLFAISFD